MIAVTSTTNAPGTTIRVASISIETLISNSMLNLNIRLYDGYGVLIRLPRPARLMTSEEKITFMSLIAGAGENIMQLIARAAAPYIESAYGITYTTT